MIRNEAGRDRAYDIAKGIGILLVVLGHTQFPGAGIIYSFHMPFFFFITGYMFAKTEALNNAIMTLLRKRAALLAVYFGSAPAFYVFWLLVGRHYGENVIKGIPPCQPFIGIFYGSGHGDWLAFNTPMWFLPCIFLAQILFRTVLEITQNRTAETMLLSAAAYWAGSTVGQVMPLPWSLDIALAMQPLVYLGYISHKNGDALAGGRGRSAQAVIFALLLLAADMANGGERVDINNRVYPGHFSFLVAAAGGSLAAWQIAGSIRPESNVGRFLALLGDRSLTILLFHLLAFKVISFIGSHVFAVRLAELKATYWSVYAAAGLVLPSVLHSAVKHLRPR